MSKKLYVGNLSYSMNDQSLQDLFTEFGTVESSKVITDRDTGRSKGFGFVEMSTDEEAQSAISELNEKEIEGRRMKVNEAKPQERNNRSGGGGGGRGRY